MLSDCSLVLAGYNHKTVKNMTFINTHYEHAHTEAAILTYHVTLTQKTYQILQKSNLPYPGSVGFSLQDNIISVCKFSTERSGNFK